LLPKYSRKLFVLQGEQENKREATLCSITLQEDKAQLKTCALVIFVEAGLSRRQYEIIKSINKKLYLCYSVLQEVKMNCYQNKESYRVTDTCAKINLQNLLNHMVTIVDALRGVVQTLSKEERISVDV
jgi:putative heme iron utilization protein